MTDKLTQQIAAYPAKYMNVETKTGAHWRIQARCIYYIQGVACLYYGNADQGFGTTCLDVFTDESKARILANTPTADELAMSKSPGLSVSFAVHECDSEDPKL